MEMENNFFHSLGKVAALQKLGVGMMHPLTVSPAGVGLAFWPTAGERLPGAATYAPRRTIQEVAKGLEKGLTPTEIAETTQRSGLGKSVGYGTLGGLGGGALLARLLEGAKAYSPLKEIWQKGLRMAPQARKLSLLARMLPLAGGAVGAGLGAGKWSLGQTQRYGESMDIAKSLLAEKVLQQRALEEAISPGTAHYMYKQPKGRVGDFPTNM